MDTNLSFLFNQSTEFLYVLDRNGAVVHTNEAFRRLLGYQEHELLGKNISEISHPADRTRREELVKNLSIKHEITGYETRIKAKNGRYFTVKLSVVLNGDNLIYATGVNSIQKVNGAKQNAVIDNIQHTIHSFNDGFFIIDDQWQITSFNPAFEAITGLTASELKNLNFKELKSLGTEEVMPEFEAAVTSNTSTQLEYFNLYFKRWLRVNIYPYKGEFTVFLRDITSQKVQQSILALEKKVLEINASLQYSFAQTIDELLLGVEAIFPDMICSVLEVDEAEERMYHLSAPSLPAEFCKVINGQPIGPRVGSCGTSVYHRTQIIVSNIETDPLWQDYKHLALPHGLKACWSTPIISPHTTKVMATFAVYYHTTREPNSEELQMIERTVNIIHILIENKRNLEYVRDQNRRLQEIAAISSHELRRPVATILGLVNLFDRKSLDSALNLEIIAHLETTARELDEVIHTIVEKTIYLQGEK